MRAPVERLRHIQVTRWNPPLGVGVVGSRAKQVAAGPDRVEDARADGAATKGRGEKNMKSPLIRPWTDDEVQKLMDCIDAGMSKLRVAAMLRRTTKSIEARARLVGKPFRSMYDVRREMQGKEAAALLNLGR